MHISLFQFDFKLINLSVSSPFISTCYQKIINNSSLAKFATVVLWATYGGHVCHFRPQSEDWGWLSIKELYSPPLADLL